MFFFNFYVKDNTILFKDKKSITQQIKFDGIPFIGNRMQESDYVQLISGIWRKSIIMLITLQKEEKLRHAMHLMKFFSIMLNC